MDDVTSTLRDAGAELRDSVHASMDLDADLAATLRRSVPAVVEPDHRGASRNRFVLVGAAAALVVVLVGVLVVVSGENSREIEPTETIGPLPSSTPAPVTTFEPPASTTEPAPPDSSPAPTAQPPLDLVLPPQPVSVPVSYLDPPTTYEPAPFASIDADSAVGEVREFAVGDGIVVITGSEAALSIVDVATGSSRSQSLAVQVSNPVLGPGNVLYGLSFTQSTDPTLATPDAAIVAQSLDTDPATIMGSAPVSAMQYVEIPRGTFVAGPDGIYDVERAPGKVMDYVIGSDPAVPTLAYNNGSDLVVRTSNSAEWALPIVADPNAAALFDGPTPPASGPNGTTRVFRYIGPQLESEPVDYGTPTKQIVADLAPGAGRWWSIPDDWKAVTSSTHGTLLVRDNSSALDLAWFEPDPPEPLEFSATRVLARSGDEFITIDRDNVGNQTQRVATDKVAWPNGCTLDDVEALFAEAPEGSVLERLACDRRSTAGPNDSSILAGNFTTNGSQSNIQLLDDPTSGPTTEFDDATVVRFANMPTSPLIPDDAVPIGDTFPVATSFSDSSTPSANALFEIAAGATTPADFGAEIARLFQQQSPSTSPTSIAYDTSTTHLVIVTQTGNTEGTEQTVHYYWLSARDQSGRLFVDRALQTKQCTTEAEGTTCA